MSHVTLTACCSYCTRTGQCSADHGVSDRGHWIGFSKACATCSPTCPRPPPPPPPVVKYACDSTNAVCFPHPNGADTNKTRCDVACGSSSGCECETIGNKTCNVCPGCCQPFILDGRACDACVSQKCKGIPPPPLPANECNPAKTCNVCKECCQTFILDGPPCDSCAKQKCPAVKVCKLETVSPVNESRVVHKTN